MVFEHSLVHEKKKIELAHGRGILVAIDIRTNKLLTELPDEIFKRYQALN
jgi:hypothetical protein